MERENHNIDKNEQFTHQRIIRDETKKTGAGTQSGDDKCFLYTFILGGIFWFARFAGLYVYPLKNVGTWRAYWQGYGVFVRGYHVLCRAVFGAFFFGACAFPV